MGSHAGSDEERKDLQFSDLLIVCRMGRERQVQQFSTKFADFEDMMDNGASLPAEESADLAAFGLPTLTAVACFGIGAPGGDRGFARHTAEAGASRDLRRSRAGLAGGPRAGH